MPCEMCLDFSFGRGWITLKPFERSSSKYFLSSVSSNAGAITVLVSKSVFGSYDNLDNDFRSVLKPVPGLFFPSFGDSYS